MEGKMLALQWFVQEKPGSTICVRECGTSRKKMTKGTLTSLVISKAQTRIPDLLSTIQKNVVKCMSGLE